MSDLLVATATLIRICTTIAHRLITSAGLMTMMVVRMDTPLAHLAKSTWHLEIQMPGDGTWHITKTWQWVLHEKSFQNAVEKSLFQVASAPQLKVMAKT